MVRTCIVLTAIALSAVAPLRAQTASVTIPIRFVDRQFQQMVSLPYATSFSDVAQTGIRGNRCVGDPGSLARPDGIVDSTDVICTLWGGGNPAWRVGALALSRWDPATCHFEASFGSHTTFGISFGGTAFPLVPGSGYALTTSTLTTPPPSYDLTLTDLCPARYPGVMVTGACAPTSILLHLPYDTAYREWDEVLCGLRGTDWDDLDRDGVPDQCPNGLFDGQHTVSVWRMDADPTSRTFRMWVGRIVTTLRVGPRRPLFSGPNLPILPGEAISVLVTAGQRPTFWNPPTTCP